ncbi:MAG: histidine kinase dimerization/phosphoacceptor domain-containing protein [Bryobacteraceae bacterium]|nr:histidine kinase dimerization/phosphoacceptor domain-containing protein [Bryobacteraceae bacterium]
MPDATGSQSALWHERDLARIARRLHDRIGPALCAAGLQLSLIEQSLRAEPGSVAAEAVAGLREALAESTEEVRTLNYVCDPDLVPRLGLKAAVAYLARMVPVDPGGLGELGARKDPAATAAFAVLRQALLYWRECQPEAEFLLVWSARAVRIIASSPVPADVAELVGQSGGTVSEDRLTATVKIDKEKVGGRK